MRVSQLFRLDRDQTSLDFVDVDVTTDVPVFVDPRAIRIQTGHWHDSCIGLLQSFFHEVLNGLKDRNREHVLSLLQHLVEPNETHLGVSKGRSRGHGLGGVGAERVVEQLSTSRAAQSGLLEDLEDTALLIEGIGPDIVSDITTNVIRGALIGYTQNACSYYEIPMERQYAGWLWNADELKWQQEFADLPVADDEKLLLVPKSIVRLSLIFESNKYYRRALAPIHRNAEIDAGSSLVFALKSGQLHVRVDDLIAKYKSSKSAVVKHTEEFPEALQIYRNTDGLATTPPLDHDVLARKTQSPRPNFQELLDKVGAVVPGNAGATMYHRAVADLLSALFYPFIGNMRIEDEIHEGRKRIDIAYDNVADAGFFKWIGRHPIAAASQVVVECKNYSRDPENPELDQISGRFSPHRTRLGIIVCRQIKNKELFRQRCRDTAKDERGYILFLDDEDMRELIKQYDPQKGEYLFLRDQFDYLIK